MMSRKLTKSGKTLFQNTMRMVNFSNRLKEENLMWKKYDKIKKRRLNESDDDNESNLAYENRYFKDESMSSVNNSMKMDISMQEESNDLSRMRHLNESDVKLKKKSKTKSKKTPTKREPIKSVSSKDVATSDSELSSSEEEDECMVDESFNSMDDKLLKTPKKSSKTAFEKKIKLREEMLKKQISKQKKKDKKEKKSKKKSKKHKK